MVTKENMIVLIDDDKNILLFLEQFLKGTEIKSKSFENPKKALSYIEKYSADIDLVITDISMPELNGIDLLIEMKRQKITKHIPVMMFTALNDRITLQKAMKNGAVDFITKPVDKEFFILKLESFLQNFKSIKESGKILSQGVYRKGDLDQLIVESNKHTSDGLLEIISTNENEYGKINFKRGIVGTIEYLNHKKSFFFSDVDAFDMIMNIKRGHYILKSL